jgi:metallo-beta-lactamase class B
MRRIAILIAVAIAARSPHHLAAQSVEPFEIADDLYWVGSDDLASFLFTSSEGHILIDVPLEENVDRIVANIRRLGFDPADVEVLLASHAHFDHVGGLARMAEITGAQVVLSRADGEMIARGGAGPTQAGPTYPPVRADRTIEHLDAVTLGGWTLTALVTPGHTPGCTSWSGGATLGGERVSFVSVCSLSVLGGYRLVGENPTYPGMGADYCRSLATLTQLDPDVFIAPHAGFFDMEDKLAALRAGDARAFVDPEGYRTWVERAGATIERTLEEQGQVGGCARLTADARFD